MPIMMYVGSHVITSRIASGIVSRIASMNARNMLSLDRSGWPTKKRAKCHVTPGAMICWQSYSTPMLVDGMMTPMRPRLPIHGSCGFSTFMSIAPAAVQTGSK